MLLRPKILKWNQMKRNVKETSIKISFHSRWSRETHRKFQRRAFWKGISKRESELEPRFEMSLQLRLRATIESRHYMRTGSFHFGLLSLWFQGHTTDLFRETSAGFFILIFFCWLGNPRRLTVTILTISRNLCNSRGLYLLAG